MHTDQEKVLDSPGYPEDYQDEQICYWHIRVRYGQQIRLHFLDLTLRKTQIASVISWRSMTAMMMFQALLEGK